MKKSKFIISFILIIYMLCVSTGFATKKTVKVLQHNSIIKKVVTASGISIGTKKNAPSQVIRKQNTNGNPNNKAATKQQNVFFTQFNPPAKGEEIAVITTNKGEIRIRLLPEYAPNTVELFKKRVNAGYYNGLSINRIIANSFIQGGTTPQNNSNSTLSVNSTLDKFNPEVRNFRGAVSVVGEDSGNNLDQFTIIQANPISIAQDPLSYMISSGEKQFPKDVINMYKKVGGTPWLDFQNVVFGQVIQSSGKGMDTVDKISRIPVDENNKPKRDIKIIKIELQPYK